MANFRPIKCYDLMFEENSWFYQVMATPQAPTGDGRPGRFLFDRIA